MKNIIYPAILFIALLTLLQSCKDENIIAPGTDTILRTDENGNVLGGDTTDWCFDSNYVGYKLYAAFPNPSDSVVHIKFNLPVVSVVKMYFDDRILINNETRQPGTYQITLSQGLYTNVIKKLYFTADYFNCSGDIEFR